MGKGNSLQSLQQRPTMPHKIEAEWQELQRQENEYVNFVRKTFASRNRVHRVWCLHQSGVGATKRVREEHANPAPLLGKGTAESKVLSAKRRRVLTVDTNCSVLSTCHSLVNSSPGSLLAALTLHDNESLT